MAKRIAVLVRERQAEALRVAVGLTLGDNCVEVFVLDRKIAATPQNATNLEVLGEVEVRIATNCADNAGFEFLTSAELARRIVACDAVVTY